MPKPHATSTHGKQQPSKAELQEKLRQIQQEVRKAVGNKRGLVDEFLAEKTQAAAGTSTSQRPGPVFT